MNRKILSLLFIILVPLFGLLMLWSSQPGNSWQASSLEQPQQQAAIQQDHLASYQQPAIAVPMLGEPQGEVGFDELTSFSSPVLFIPDHGQFAGRGAFEVSAGGNSLLFTDEGVQVKLGYDERAAHVQIEFLKADYPLRPGGLDRSPGVAHYYEGSDESQWVTDVPLYNGVVYRNLYPGIDLRYASIGSSIKTEFELAPGTSPQVIRIRYAGAEALTIDDTGELRVDTAAGYFTEAPPYAYQLIDGVEVPVRASFRIQGDVVSFEVGKYDATRPLIIDPVILFYNKLGTAVEYLSHFLKSFPNGDYVVATTVKNTEDMRITRYKANGTLQWVTYLRGANFDAVRAILLTSNGRVVVGGTTDSPNFPTTANAADKTCSNNGLCTSPGSTFRRRDATLTILDGTTGKMNNSTFLGGNGSEAITGIAVDQNQNIYVSGLSFLHPEDPLNFPVTPGSIPVNTTALGNRVFVVKYSSIGSVVYATLVATTMAGWPEPRVAVGQNGVAYVNDGPILRRVNATGTGYAGSDYGIPGDPYAMMMLNEQLYVVGQTTFPLFGINAIDSTLDGPSDAFLAIYNLNLTPLFFTYIGGEGEEIANDFGIGPDGVVYVVGQTNSEEFPLLKPVKKHIAGPYDGFVTAIKPPAAEPAALVFSTFLGDLQGLATQNEATTRIAVDNTGMMWLLHNTGDWNLQIQDITFLLRMSPADGMNLRVEMEAQPATLPAGDTVTYTLRVANFGNLNGEQVTLNVPFPGLITYTLQHSDFPSDCSVNSDNHLNCSWAVLEAGELPPMRVAFVPNVGGEFSTNAVIAGTASNGSQDIYMADNVASSLVIVKTGLAIKITGPDTATAGKPVTYTIEVKNYGPQEYTQVHVQNQIEGPALARDKMKLPNTAVFSTTAVSGDNKLLSASTEDQTFPVQYKPEGIKLTVPITIPEGSKGTFTQTVSISGQQVGTGDPDPDPKDNEHVLSVKIIQPGADLGVNITPHTTTVTAGFPITYSIVITNYGGEDAKDVTITATLGAQNTPAHYISQSGTDFDVATACTVTTTSTSGRENQGGVVKQRCVIPGIFKADTYMEYQLVVVPGQVVGQDELPQGLTQFPAMAFITGTGGTVNDVGVFLPSGNPDPDLEDNTKSSPASMKTGADLSASILNDQFLPNNENFKVTLFTENDGPEIANTVEMDFVLPTGLNFVSGDENFNTQKCLYHDNDRRVFCVFTDRKLAPQAEIRVELTLFASQKGFYTTTLKVEATSTFSQKLDQTFDHQDVIRANNERVKKLEVRDDAVLKVTLAAEQTPPYVGVGENTSFELRLDNLGPKEAKNVQLTMQLPNGGSFVSFPGTCQASNGDATLTCTPGDIANGATPYNGHKIVVKAPDEVPPDTMLILTGSATGDNVETPATASAQIKVREKTRLDVSITQSPHPILGPIGVSDPFTYTIDVHNFGPKPTTVTTLTLTFAGDYLPAGGVSLMPAGTCNTPPNAPGLTLVCTYPGLALKEKLTVVLRATAPAEPGTLRFTARAASNLLLIGPGQASIATPVRSKVNLILSLSDDIDPISPGAVHTITVKVQNTGQEKATGVYVVFGDGVSTDRQKIDLTDFCKPYVGDGAAGLKNAVRCDLPVQELLPSQEFEFWLFLRAPLLDPDETEKQLHSVAFVYAKEANGNPGSATETTTVREKADMRIAGMPSSVSRVRKGGTADLEVRIVNRGPDRATNPKLMLTLPPLATLQSMGAPGGWTCNTAVNPIVCTSTTPMEKNKTHTFRLEVRVDENTNEPAFQIWAEVESPQDPKPVDLRRDAQGWQISDGVDLFIEFIEDDRDPAAPGDVVVYRVKYKNLGPDKTPAKARLVFTPNEFLEITRLVENVGATCTGVSFCDMSANFEPDDDKYIRVEARIKSDAPDGAFASLLVKIDLLEHKDLERDLLNNIKTKTTRISTDADLQLTLKAHPTMRPPGSNIHAGDLMTILGTLTNKGPNKASGLKAVLTVDNSDRVTFVKENLQPLCQVTKFAGETKLECNLDDLPDKEIKELEFTFKVAPDMPEDTVVNYSLVVTSDTNDPDGAAKSGNFFVKTLADLQIEVAPGGNWKALAPEYVEMTVKIFNQGPSVARGVKFQSIAPSLSFKSINSLPDGAFSCTVSSGLVNNSLNCDHQVEYLDAFATLTIVYRVDADDPGVAIQSISASSSTLDDAPANNAKTARIRFERWANLKLNLTLIPDVVLPGNTARVSASVYNIGPNDANDVVFTLDFEAVQNLVVPAGCTNVGFSVTCQVGQLQKIHNRDFSFSFYPNRTQTISGVVSHPDYDPDMLNNQDSKRLTINFPR